jgi:serine/threonine-protein kinase
VKLLDFGHGALHDGSSPKLTQSGFFAGTPGYIAPERLLGGAHDARSDVYGAAVCLYEAIAGRAAFHASSPLALHAAIVQGSAVPLTTVRPDVPAALAAVVARAMHVDPTHRFESATELAQALEEALGPPRAAVDPYARTLGVARPSSEPAHVAEERPAQSALVRPAQGAPVRPAQSVPVRAAQSAPVRPSQSPPHRGRGPLPLLAMALALGALATVGVWMLRGGDAAARDAHAPPTRAEASRSTTEAAPSPVEAPPSPVEAPRSPVEAPRSPVEAPRSPVEATPSPVEAPRSPVEAAPSPAEAPRSPVEAPRSPVEAPRSPAEAPRSPVEAAPSPAEAPPSTVRAPRTRSSSTHREVGPATTTPSEERAPSEAGEPEAPAAARSSHPDEIFVPSWAQ